jgi:ArsR family transcriptional regulator
MDSTKIILALAALAQPTRLDLFRLLTACEPAGLAAGDLARALAVPQNTLSSQVAVLTRAGLARSERRGRSIVYRADLESFRALALALLNDCCGGRPGLCAPLIDDLASPLAPESVL